LYFFSVCSFNVLISSLFSFFYMKFWMHFNMLRLK
jgi:hypothetical protein